MKQLIYLTMSAMLLSVGAFAGNKKDRITAYKVLPEKSNVYWTGRKVTGEHTGTISLDAGELNLQEEKIVSGEIKMNMNSISCSDLTDPQWNKKLVDHLKSDDFFSTEKYPHSVFKATRFEPKQGADDDSNYLVTGNMTIKGITHEISFPATVKIHDGMLTATGTAVLDRTKWNVEYRSGSIFKGLGDKMIYDEFDVKFQLVAGEESNDL